MGVVASERVRCIWRATARLWVPVAAVQRNDSSARGTELRLMPPVLLWPLASLVEPLVCLSSLFSKTSLFLRPASIWAPPPRPTPCYLLAPPPSQEQATSAAIGNPREREEDKRRREEGRRRAPHWPQPQLLYSCTSGTEGPCYMTISQRHTLATTHHFTAINLDLQ